MEQREEGECFELALCRKSSDRATRILLDRRCKTGERETQVQLELGNELPREAKSRAAS